MTGAGPIGSSTPLIFDHATRTNMTFKSHTFETINGTILIYWIRGNLNGNGWVDIGDTVKTAYMVVEMTPDLVPDANTHNSGVIDAGDASKIARNLVGKISEL
jgi:hypothetical protein